MSEQNETINVKASLPPGPVYLPPDNSPVAEGKEPTLNVAQVEMSPAERKQRKAMIVSALDRGVLNDRMAVALPPHLHGEWVRRDPVEIDAMRRLGFEVDTEFAPKRALNTDGTGAAFVADVVFMTCPREQKELINEVKHERFLAMHSKRGENKEEKEFVAGTRAETDGIIPTTVESQTRDARKDDIASALDAMNKQTP